MTFYSRDYAHIDHGYGYGYGDPQGAGGDGGPDACAGVRSHGSALGTPCMAVHLAHPHRADVFAGVRRRCLHPQLDAVLGEVAVLMRPSFPAPRLGVRHPGTSAGLAIAVDHDLTKRKVKQPLDAAFAAIAAAVANGKEAAMLGFGEFKVSDRPAREGRNSGTGAAIQIAASRNPAFVPVKQLNDLMNGARRSSRTTGSPKRLRDEGLSAREAAGRDEEPAPGQGNRIGKSV